jgi:hypothetical protein
MSQDFTSQELSAGGGNGSTSTGFVTGQVCTVSGTYRASNKYMDIISLYVVGETFRTMYDGRKATWYPLTSSLSTNNDGSFSSVKVTAGSV